MKPENEPRVLLLLFLAFFFSGVYLGNNILLGIGVLLGFIIPWDMGYYVLTDRGLFMDVVG